MKTIETSTRRKAKVSWFNVFLSIFTTAGVCGLGATFLYIFSKIWIRGYVILVEPNKAILAMEVFMNFILLLSAFVLFRRTENLLAYVQPSKRKTKGAA